MYKWVRDYRPPCVQGGNPYGLVLVLQEVEAALLRRLCSKKCTQFAALNTLPTRSASSVTVTRNIYTSMLSGYHLESRITVVTDGF